jgi:hypothetical protein
VKKQFSEAQIAYGLRQAGAGTPVGETTRKIKCKYREQAESFMASFSDKWRKASIPDRKLLIRRVVKGITVDRAHGDFTSTFYRLPKINNPIVTAILQNFGSGVHSKVCPEQDANLPDLASTTP